MDAVVGLVLDQLSAVVAYDGAGPEPFTLTCRAQRANPVPQHEVLAIRPHGGERNGPGWAVRVVPNKFPALQIEGDLNKRGEGIYDKMNGVGASQSIAAPDARLPVNRCFPQ